MIPPLRPQRAITGISAVLLPFGPDGLPDLDSFQALLKRTLAAGLTPAVNMDTGYANLLSQAQRTRVLELTLAICQGRKFAAGAYIENLDWTGNFLDLYLQEIEAIQSSGGIPVLFQSTPLADLPLSELVPVYQRIASASGELIAFELGPDFAPFGRIYSLEVFQALMEIPQITGLKHSSLSRRQEWERLSLRDNHRPEFKIYTGNDLAIDMVAYGSDYLLGLSTFAPDFFAIRDQLWLDGDPAFWELNDILQYLGWLAFRPPIPAYKHSAAQFLHLRGWIESPEAPPGALMRPESDLVLLSQILERLDGFS